MYKDPFDEIRKIMNQQKEIMDRVRINPIRDALSDYYEQQKIFKSSIADATNSLNTFQNNSYIIADVVKQLEIPKNIMSLVTNDIRDFHFKNNLMNLTMKNNLQQLNFTSLYNKIDWHESNQIIKELSKEANEETIIEEEDPSTKEYTDQQVDFIRESLERWINGSIDLSKLVEYLKTSSIKASIILYVLHHVFNILMIIGYHNMVENDQPTVDIVQEYIKEEVYPFKLYTKYMVQEKLITVNKVGFTRNNVYIREGRCKSAPVKSPGKLEKKTVVYMFETKNGWRRIEVKIDDTFVQGWVPESSLIRLKQNQLHD